MWNNHGIKIYVLTVMSATRKASNKYIISPTGVHKLLWLGGYINVTLCVSK